MWHSACSDVVDNQSSKLESIIMGKIPPNIEADVMYKSDLKCCVCQNKGDHIHHIDSNNKNNMTDNLALLCFDHHNQATIKGSLSRKLSPKTILKYRELHYLAVETERKRRLGEIDSTIQSITHEDLIDASKTALVIFELEKLFDRFHSSNTEHALTALYQINNYSKRIDVRVSLEVIDFLSTASYRTRGGMNYNVALSLMETMFNFCPSLYREKSKINLEIYSRCIQIGFSIAYDAFIHLRNIAIGTIGLTMIKFVYRAAKNHKLDELANEALSKIDELRGTLNRPERPDLVLSIRLISEYLDDIDDSNLSFPVFSDDILDVFQQDTTK